MYAKKKDGRHCEGCGQTLAIKLVKKMKASPPGTQFLCKSCTTVRRKSLFRLELSISNFPLNSSLYLAVLCAKSEFYFFAVNEFKALLRHLQEDLESFG